MLRGLARFAGCRAPAGAPDHRQEGEAIANGSKELQHRYTVPILRDVLTREGFRAEDVNLATELINHDVIGHLMQSWGTGSQTQVVAAITQKAKTLGMPVADFATLQLAVYYADAGAYPHIRDVAMTVDPSGKVAMRHDRLSKVQALADGKRTAEQARVPAGSPEGGQWSSGDTAARGSEVEALNAAMVQVVWPAGKSTAWTGAPSAAPSSVESAHLDERGRVKAAIVQDLGGRLAHLAGEEDRDGTPINPVAFVQSKLDTWADTSGDHSVTAIIAQHAVAEAFHLDAALGHFDDTDMRELQDGTKVPYPATEASLAYVHAEYDATQAWFAARGITHVSLFRGERVTPHPEGPQTVTMQPASSWTTSLSTALRFATEGLEHVEERDDHDRTVLTTRVPVSRVLSTGLTGRGCLSEAEVLLLGGPTPVRVFAALKPSSHAANDRIKASL